MSSTTSGSLGFVAANADLAKEVGAHVIVIPAGGNVAQVANPAVPQQAFTAYNDSLVAIRGTITFNAGITSAGAVATRTFLIPPKSTASQDFGATTDDANANIEAIDSISFVAVTVAATAEASTLVAAPALIAPAIIYVNFVTR